MVNDNVNWNCQNWNIKELEHWVMWTKGPRIGWMTSWKMCEEGTGAEMSGLSIDCILGEPAIFTVKKQYNLSL